MEILSKIKSEIVVPLITLVFALALLYFLWGVAQYVRNQNNPTERQEGQRHMFWGIVGIAIMLSAFGIVNFVFNTIADNSEGVGGQQIERPDVLQPGQGF